MKLPKSVSLGIAAASVLFLGLVNASSDTKTSPTNYYSNQPIPQEMQKRTGIPEVKSVTDTRVEDVNIAQPKTVVSKPSSINSQGLSNDNYYTNTYGNKVHSPAYSNTVPSGATARCGDGTYSFSQSRRGTCSHHGGVAQWL